MRPLDRFLHRMHVLVERAESVLSMNRRNLHYVYTRNEREHFPIADDKLRAKEVLLPAGVRMPETYLVYSQFFQLSTLEKDLSVYTEFVIKPAQGSGGSGIIVIAGRRGRDWLGVSGKVYTLYDLQKHISDIIFGVFSFDLGDQAIIESRIMQHPEVQALSPLGLADVRIILCDDTPVMAMTRIPSRKSDGKANLHQGALGVAIDIPSGVTFSAQYLRQAVTRHPDSGAPLIGITLPFWQEIVAMACTAARTVPLKYLGVDIAITPDGPCLLELNVRPGLEIQNINLHGLRPPLEALAMNEDGKGDGNA